MTFAQTHCKRHLYRSLTLIFNLFQRWVWAYRQNQFLVSINTNNGVERMNELLKYQYLMDRNKSSLSGMITVVIEEFLPEKYTR